MKRLFCLVCAFALLAAMTACAPAGRGLPEAEPESGAPETSGSMQPGKEPEKTEEKPVQTAAFSSGCTNMTVRLPEGRTYETGDAGAASLSGMRERTGLTFWPEAEPEFAVALKYSAEPVGLCGTGVEFENVQLSNGRTATKCTSADGDGLFTTKCGEVREEEPCRLVPAS